MTGYTHIDSPVGSLLVAGDDDALHYLSFPNSPKAFGPRSDWHQTDAPFLEVRRQLTAYFDGELRQFDLPFFLTGTVFQKKVWRLLSEIPYGVTRSYGALANDLEAPKASRAVGMANGANPIPIIIPCHRVIGSTGKLTGFGGGIETKRFLLDLENPTPMLF
ncbi:MAG: methylated-DNA--[protein]-cysteine S-methyltransferase [Granulosicoccus sp.]